MINNLDKPKQKGKVLPKTMSKQNNNNHQLNNGINPQKNINTNNKFQLSIIAKPPHYFRDLSYTKYQLE